MISQAEAYQETYTVLKYMDRKTVMKVPEEILEFIIKNKDNNYKVKIDKMDPLNPENIDEKTCNIITWINLKYWADESEKKKINEILTSKYINYHNNKIDLKEEIFEKQKSNYKNNNQKDIILYNNKFSRIINMIKKIFRK